MSAAFDLENVGSYNGKSSDKIWILFIVGWRYTFLYLVCFC